MQVALYFVACAAFAVTPMHCWPAFRGDGTSVADNQALPVTWGDQKSVAWRTDIDGYGQSSPVVWGDLIVVTSVAGPEKTELLTAGYDLGSGKRRWLYRAAGTQGIADSDMTSKAAPTPAIDAERVYAFFESGNVIALDHQGQPLWSRDLVTDYGPFKCNHGLGSSPVLTRDAVVLLIEHEGPSYLLALDKATGATRWKSDHTSRVSWSSPVVSSEGNAEEILVSSNGFVEAIDPTDGKTRWQLEGLKGNTVPSPTPTGNRVLVGSSDVGFNMLVDRSKNGEGTATSENRIVWRTREAAASFGSPLVYGDYVYFINKAGAAACLSLEDGKLQWTERMPESCWASPIGSDGHVYFFGKSGITTVVRAGPKFERIAENTLAVEGRVYGVAAVNRRFIVRTGRQLIALGDAP
jgi:outer membrane protein assembly factor BamB